VVGLSADAGHTTSNVVTTVITDSQRFIDRVPEVASAVWCRPWR